MFILGYDNIYSGVKYFANKEFEIRYSSFIGYSFEFRKEIYLIPEFNYIMPSKKITIGLGIKF